MKYKFLLACGLVCCTAACAINNQSQDDKATPAATAPVADSLQTNNAEENCEYTPENKYKEVSYPTPNYARDKVNDVRGVILHHTAEPTMERSLAVLTSKEKGVGTHVVIDTDGTRYVMCAPTVVTYHAGYSILAGRESCNQFTIGIEFQGNTLEKPLTDDQIASAIEYLRPIIKQYDIPVENIVTHEMVRNAYKKKYPNKRISGKVDITPTEYKRVMKEFRTKLYNMPAQ